MRTLIALSLALACTAARADDAAIFASLLRYAESREVSIPAAVNGKATTPAPAMKAPPVVSWPSYPTRSVSGRRWNMGGGRQITAEHLAGSHHSHERFDYDWLRTLNNAQLTALGSDAHEGNVREQFVVRRAVSHRLVFPNNYSKGVLQTGGWVTQRVCDRYGCRNVRVWMSY